MKFQYTAFDKAGKSVRESIEAPDQAEATELLRKRGLFVTEIVESSRSGPVAAAAVRRGSARLKDLTNFSRQLSVLVSTGTPLVEAMEALERQSAPGPWRDVVADVRRRVEEGKQLSEAMEAHPNVFDGICRSLVAAGEGGGKLDKMLDRLARLTRQQQKVKSSVAGAMLYPCLLIVVGLAVMCVMVGFVMPRFEGLFKTLGAPLPPSTEVLMACAKFMREYWWGVLGGLIVGGVAGRFWLTSPGGRVVVDGLLVSMPQIGKVTRAFATARIARVLGVLLEGKVALLDALRLTRQATGNVRYVALIERVEDAVTRGESVSAAFASRAGGGPELIAPSVCEAVKSGEKTGQIGPVLLSVAESMDEDNEVLVKAMTSLIEPLILVGLGLMVGVVAISMFMPLFDLTAAGGNPGVRAVNLSEHFALGLSHGPIGLDVGSRAIKAVQLAREGDGPWRVEGAVSVPRLEPAAALSERELGRVLGVLDRRGFSGAEFAIAAPPSALMSGALELPARSSGAPIEQIARLELARTYRCAPESFEMAYWDVPAPVRAGEGTHLMAVGCPHDGVEPVLGVFDALGADVSSVDVRSCALARACAPMACTAPTMTAILELGWSRGLLVMLHQDVVVYERTMEEGAVGVLHGRIREQLDTDAEVADHVLGAMELRAPMSECRRGVEMLGRAGRLVSSFIEGLVRELSLSVAYISSRYPGVGGAGGVGKLLLAGGNASMPGLATRLSEGLGIEARVVTPADLAAAPPEIMDDCSSPAMVTALGLARRRRGGRA